MQFGLQVERQEFGTLGFYDGNVLQGDSILEAPCFVVVEGFVVLGDVCPGNRGALRYGRDREIHGELRARRFLHDIAIAKKPETNPFDRFIKWRMSVKWVPCSFSGRKSCFVNVHPPPTIIEIEMFEMPGEK
jgi:hypothetical protein